ncbi:carbon-nitrogen hydrolase family protein [Bradyrhizobium sp. AUGA SZCCT0051]|nr:carbon-nitrogen hydrolase family protein [Bradyrhizobium sp. AUGA SZCCT0124]MBR1314605.1 carbon-nitrogen hydrolase family protein [Bradyrhizobium sp. AUGA SZCCT0051]MBR1342375.1 carbon-nitrogen hydrolase family protein [Bradyrhizobium sp. AUGA SZCCT0105]MBR1352605.1 carbon-nitrogen hydrolase family protein [Bradyrhizobium sp. AUGA SZCCT0045]
MLPATASRDAAPGHGNRYAFQARGDPGRRGTVRSRGVGGEGLSPDPRGRCHGGNWLPGYPFFCHAPTGPSTFRAMAEYLDSSVEIPSPATDRLCDAAEGAGIDVVIGVAERDAVTKGTVYCTLLFIGREGRILGRHRKLKPTFNERSVWADGDAVGLRVHERPYGRISGLNCWEHNTMLPGYALAAQGTQIHVAAWPGREPAVAPPSPTPLWPRQLLLSRAFASQAGCYVIAVGGMRSHEATPERYRELSTIEYSGDSVIIDPRGEIIAGPAQGETILIADGSREVVLAAKALCDIGGHYSRPDLLRLIVDRDRQDRVIDCAFAGRVAPDVWE